MKKRTRVVIFLLVGGVVALYYLFVWVDVGVTLLGETKKYGGLAGLGLVIVWFLAGAGPIFGAIVCFVLLFVSPEARGRPF